MANNVSETKTENIFRDFYCSTTFIEKSAIPTEYGFKSKKGTRYKGYPDFFKDLENYVIVVEAKATIHKNAIEEVQFYMLTNNIHKDIIGIAISGQTGKHLKVSYFYKAANDTNIIEFSTKYQGRSVPNQESLFQIHEE